MVKRTSHACASPGYPVVTLNWKEKGGPLVAPPKREGFGTMLIAQCATSLSGKVSQRFSFDGFGCSLTFRLPAAGALIPRTSAVTEGLLLKILAQVRKPHH